MEASRENTLKQSEFLNRAIAFPNRTSEVDRYVALLSDYLSTAFHVSVDEIGLLVLDRTGSSLVFVAPNYLVRLGASFPFSTACSVAAQSLRYRRVQVENSFATVNHLSHFERAKVPNSRPARIEKMLTYPVYMGRYPLGLVQVSRKWSLASPVLPDFSKKDADLIREIEPSIVRVMLAIRSGMRSFGVETKSA